MVGKDSSAYTNKCRKIKHNSTRLPRKSVHNEALMFPYKDENCPYSAPIMGPCMLYMSYQRDIHKHIHTHVFINRNRITIKCTTFVIIGIAERTTHHTRSSENLRQTSILHSAFHGIRSGSHRYASVV